ncbi:MAG TPA: HYExAFE family protein [Planctomycetaceae bacterium]
MALRSNHYDAAFEAYLRQRRVPYVAVDEKRRSLLEEASLKSMDFIVRPTGGESLLVDVKGRRYPTAGNGGRWENWVTTDDVKSLLRWEEVFGAGHRAVFVFAYDVDPGHEGDFEELFPFREKQYAFYGVAACDYRAVMTTRSPRWETVSVARKPFAELRSPIDSFLEAPVRRP